MLPSSNVSRLARINQYERTISGMKIWMVPIGIRWIKHGGSRPDDLRSRLYERRGEDDDDEFDVLPRSGGSSPVGDEFDEVGSWTSVSQPRR